MLKVEKWYEEYRGNDPDLGENTAVISLLRGRPSVWLEKRGREYYVCAPPNFSLQVRPEEAIRNLGRFPDEIRIQGVFHRLVHS